MLYQRPSSASFLANSIAGAQLRAPVAFVSASNVSNTVYKIISATDSIHDASRQAHGAEEALGVRLQYCYLAHGEALFGTGPASVYLDERRVLLCIRQR
jgi:hypothetical protein